MMRYNVTNNGQEIENSNDCCYTPSSFLETRAHSGLSLTLLRLLTGARLMHRKDQTWGITNHFFSDTTHEKM
jgi:hypothetical protein